jgi:hypothetical protein
VKNRMPWGDGTGPWGLGPMTGRAAGYCAGYSVPGYMNPIPGFGFGFGFGRGFRKWLWGYPWYGLPFLYMTYGRGYRYPWNIYATPSYTYSSTTYQYQYAYRSAPYMAYW